MHTWITQREEGQSLVVVGFAIITLVAFVGLAVDLGLAYVERVRVRRAADAAALAAASELPLEDTAHWRALELLDENDCGCGLEIDAWNQFGCTDDTVHVSIDGWWMFGPEEEEASRVIKINTADYRQVNDSQNSTSAVGVVPGEPDTATKIRVEVTSNAPVYFMRVFDFFDMPVKGHAVAENINNLDVAIVFDKSISMEFDTLCYGCWSEDGEYPNGQVHPLTWGPDPAGTATHCSGNDPKEHDGHTYYIIEAEEYSETNVPYSRELYNLGKTYWVIQRNGAQADSHMRDNNGAGAYGRDERGAYIQHMPPRRSLCSDNDGTGVQCRWDDVTTTGLCRTVGCNNSDPFPFGDGFPAPHVDYEFDIENSGDWHIWIRAQHTGQGDYVFWGLDGDVVGRRVSNSGSGDWKDGASANKWGWMRLAPGYSGDQDEAAQFLSAGTHTLSLWAGAPAFAVDRIIITDDDDDDELPDEVLTSNDFDNNRTGLACDPCDPRFGGSPANDPIHDEEDVNTPYCEGSDDVPQPYRYLDDIYDDEQPIRDAVEAAKYFINLMDFKFDQVGLVKYSGSAGTVSELKCLRTDGDDCDETVIEEEVIEPLDGLRAGGGTNIGAAIREGIEVLDTQDGNGRPGAAHVMILMTDGQANKNYSECMTHLDEDDPDTWLWPDHVDQGTKYWKGKECAMHEAYRALDNGIVIHTVTLGGTADVALLQEIANLTGGIHRSAEESSELEGIFEELYKRIFLRLTE